jgi:hypothetical protein
MRYYNQKNKKLHGLGTPGALFEWYNARNRATHRGAHNRTTRKGALSSFRY